MKGSQRERSGYPQREVHQTHSVYQGINPTILKRVGANVQHPKRKEFSTQNFISSQNKLHKVRRNKILYRQATSEKFYHHQACPRRIPEGSTIHGKEQTVPATAKAYQTIKTIETLRKAPTNRQNNQLASKCQDQIHTKYLH